jgi:hypothetical protein
MSSIIAFEPYVVRTGRGEPFIQSGIYKTRITRGISFGPNFVSTRSRLSRIVNFVQ